MKSGSQGFSGKRTVNALTMFDQLFTIQESSSDEEETETEDSDDLMSMNLEN